MARMFEASREGEAGVGLYINSLVSLRTFWPSIWSNPTSLRLTGSTRKAAFLPPSFSPPTFSCGAARSTRSAGWRRLRRLWPNTSPRQLLSQEWTDCARWETGQHQDGDGECKVFLVVYFQLVEIKFLIIIYYHPAGYLRVHLHEVKILEGWMILISLLLTRFPLVSWTL